MKITKTSTIYSSTERQMLRKLISEKYGKQLIISDCREDSFVCKHIEEVTGEKLGGSTISRITGLDTKYKGGTYNTSIDIVARYLGFKNHIALSKHIKQKLNVPPKDFSFEDIFHQHIIRIEIAPNKMIELRLLKDGWFEVIKTKNTKFNTDDKLKISNLEIDYSFECEKVTRLENNNEVELGAYTSGNENHVNGISLVKP